MAVERFSVDDLFKKKPFLEVTIETSNTAGMRTTRWTTAWGWSSAGGKTMRR